MIASPIISSLEWSLSGVVPYVSHGELTIGEGQLSRKLEWSVDEFTSDPKQVRRSFTIDESKLPFGTRLETNPQGGASRVIRYVGGDLGEKEFYLKEQAIRVIVERS